MKSELNREKNILKSKNNDWAILNLLCSYLKRNRSIIVSICVFPILFIALVASNFHNLSTNKSNINGSFILMIIWLTQTASFAIQNFLTILLDLKQTVIYRRIGLTRITKTKFILITSIFNLVLLLISDFFVFLIFIALSWFLHLTPLLTTIMQWKLLLIILFTITISVTFTSFGLLMSTIIKTRVGQTITNVCTNVVIITPAMILIIFLNKLFLSSNKLIEAIGTINLIGIGLLFFVLINALSLIFYYLTWKRLKWFD